MDRLRQHHQEVRGCGAQRRHCGHWRRLRQVQRVQVGYGELRQLHRRRQGRVPHAEDGRHLRHGHGGIRQVPVHLGLQQVVLLAELDVVPGQGLRQDAPELRFHDRPVGPERRHRADRRQPGHDGERAPGVHGRRRDDHGLCHGAPGRRGRGPAPRVSARRRADGRSCVGAGLERSCDQAEPGCRAARTRAPPQRARAVSVRGPHALSLRPGILMSGQARLGGGSWPPNGEGRELWTGQGHATQWQGPSMWRVSL
mmetsp:Transcript_9263/g.25483  ORF Transcript_9263/g.25483 Transcript_9263/m.25483 type:complete len:255 (+) Transcript_9263:750-1514(+)